MFGENEPDSQVLVAAGTFENAASISAAIRLWLCSGSQWI